MSQEEATTTRQKRSRSSSPEKKAEDPHPPVGEAPQPIAVRGGSALSATAPLATIDEPAAPAPAASSPQLEAKPPASPKLASQQKEASVTKAPSDAAPAPAPAAGETTAAPASPKADEASPQSTASPKAASSASKKAAVDHEWAEAWGEAATAVRDAREAALRMKAAVSAEAAGAEDFEMVTTFLLAKEFWAQYSDRARAFNIERVLKPDDPPSAGRRDRLDRLLATEGDATFDDPPKGWTTLEGFCDANPAWREAGAYIHRRRDGKVPQRHQLSGLCYLHAPVIQQHYLVELSNANHEGMVDMAKMIRRWKGKPLHNHILNDDGGDSHETLKRILHPKSLVPSLGTFDNLIVREGLKSVEDYLKQYGPGLISAFTVFEDFIVGAQMTFAGSPRGATKGHHAMVLLGVRKDAKGKYFFLLQNWWKRMQFVEVDEEYMLAANPKLSFVLTAQQSIPQNLPSQGHFLAENENLDKPETVMCEDDPVPSPDQMKEDQ